MKNSKYAGQTLVLKKISSKMYYLEILLHQKIGCYFFRKYHKNN